MKKELILWEAEKKNMTTINLIRDFYSVSESPRNKLRGILIFIFYFSPQAAGN
jgi:hypothetical protein